MTRLLQTLLVLGVVGCARSEKAEPTLDPNRPESTPIAATEVERTDTSPPPPAAEIPPTAVPATPAPDTPSSEDVRAASPSAATASHERIEGRSTLEMTVVSPSQSTRLREVNRGNFSLRVQLKNVGRKTLTLWPYLTVTVRDARGKAVPTSMHLGRFGFRSKPSIIESISFVSVEPGELHEIEVNLKQYRFDPRVITGWRFPRPGRYHLELTYAYQRSQALREFGKGCQDPQRADAPWNRALEVSTAQKLELRITR